MRKSAALVLVGIIVSVVAMALPSVGWAQNVGTLSGHVYDQAGLPLRGVAVTISSPTQIGGARTERTNDEGAFRFAGLIPGRFKVTASAPKLRSVVQENVPVTGGNTTDIDLILEVDTGVEEIQIVQKAPTINQTSTKIGESFDEEFMNSLPLQSRDYQGVAALTAGVRDSGDGNPQVRGGTSFSNTYTVDGFNTTDPVTRTFSQNFSFSSMNTVEVTTAAVGAENAGTTGGLINIATKSGSNRFEFDTSVEYSDQNLELFKDQRDIGTNRFMRLNSWVGGPIVRDRLWYALSGAFAHTTSTLSSDPNSTPHPSYRANGFDGTAKVTWRPSTRNQIDFLATASPAAFDNALQSPLIEPEAEARQFQRSEFLGLTYQYIGPLYLLSRVGYRQQGYDVGPQSCQWDPVRCTQVPAEIDLLTGVQRGNYSSQQLDQRRTVLFSGHTEYVIDSRRFGGHALRLGWEYEAMKHDLRATVPGDAIFSNLGTTPFRRTEVCSNDPLSANGECRQNFLRSAVTGSRAQLNLTDSYKPTRYLTLKPGVAFQYGSSENDKNIQVTDMTAWTPHLAVIWDPTRDGRTKLQTSLGVQADTGFLALARFTGRQLCSRQCSWDEMTQTYSQDCRSDGGSDSVTVGLPCGPTGIGPDGHDCRTKLKAPKVWEAVVGGEREIMTGVSLGANFVNRRFTNQWEDVETNANWNEGGTALRRESPFKTERSQFIYDLQTPAAAERTYRGVTVQFRKREGRAKALINYTLSRYVGPVDASFTSAFLDNPGQTQYYYGPLPSDSRHELRAQASYQLLSWLAVGANYMFFSGGPYNRFVFDPVTGGFGRFAAHRGYDSRGTLNPDDDVALRLPDLSVLGLQARVTLEPLIKQRIEIWADALNLLALRTTTSVIQQDGQFFGRASSRLPPLSLRLGLRYRY